MFNSNAHFLAEAVFQNKKSMAFLFVTQTLFFGLVTLVFFLLFDSLFPYAPLVSQFIVLVIALFGLGQFIKKKEQYKIKYGDEAYQKAFYRFHVTFIPLIYVSAFHSVFLLPYKTGFFEYLNVRIAIASYFLLSALLLHYRTNRIFGLDNLFMFYVYHPEKSALVQSVIHKILRHPVYSAMSRLAIGLAILRGTPEALAIALMLPLNQFCWINLFEEPDLSKRFGKDYEVYQKSVWAIVVKPSKLLLFWKFLLGFSK
ncbi:MAG: hypothetical protein MJE63_33645 [Proteobacteria bacterium]|nr:hypothetical protein [Pseudomonadota bacterium]